MLGSRAMRAPVSIPVIPSMVVGPLIEEQEPVLLWVHTGTATVETAGMTHRLASGEALWVPPGVEHCTRVDEGAVVFPFFLSPPELPGALSEVHVVSIPAGWEEWLIHRWDDNSYTRDEVVDAGPLLRLIAQTPEREDRSRTTVGALPLPRSREALDVARTLLRTPGTHRDVAWFAAQENISGKTLQRRFRKETGMAFSLWRTRARIAVAARHLTAGREIGWTSRQVGYATPTGFTKAFRRHTGLTPREFARRDRTDAQATTIATAEGLEQTIARGAHVPEKPPRVPARAFWDRVNPVHELMWVYRGEARIRIGTHHWELRRGQAIWVPAGLTHGVEFAADSLMMTIGTAHGRVRIGADELIVFNFPTSAEAFLLHTMVGEYSAFQPDSMHSGLAARLFHEQFGPTRFGTTGLTGVPGDIAAALSRNPADRRSLTDWAAVLHTTPTELGKQFRTQTGDTFPQWRSRIRMDAARDLLRFGEPPGQVFRQLGYASAAAFSRAFTTAHGISPREYQRREARPAEAFA